MFRCLAPAFREPELDLGGARVALAPFAPQQPPGRRANQGPKLPFRSKYKAISGSLGCGFLAFRRVSGMNDQRRILPFLFMCLVGFIAAACEEKGLTPVVGGGADGSQNPATAGCTDVDGDGFYADCTPTDCNDGDSDQTDGCYACLTPNEGCPCEEDGAVAECGHVSSVVDGFVSCVTGTRECINGNWGACSTDGIETRALPSGSTFQGVSEYPTPCASNPCAPYCHQFPEEDPETHDNAVIDDDGLTLSDSPPPANQGGQSCGGDEQVAERTPLGMILMVDQIGRAHV